MKLTDQLIQEIQARPEEFERLKYGEIVFRVQNGKVVAWDVRQTFKAQSAKAGPKNGRSKS